MEAAAALLAEIGVTASMTEATIERLEALSRRANV
jgi:hypothetical protein